MRLIDADKIEYMWYQDRNGKFHEGVTLESIVNNMPIVNVNDVIVKELEKIKAEITKKKMKYFYGDGFDDSCICSGLEYAEDILDKYIKENRQ